MFSVGALAAGVIFGIHGRSHNAQIRVVTTAAGAKVPAEPVIAIEASSDQSYELKYIYAKTTVKAIYHFAGREFIFGIYAGRPVVLTSPGGGIVNAAIGTTLAIQHFNVSAVGFVGIGGISPGGRVGDTCVASAAVEADQGNWYDFADPKGDVEPGLTWYLGGQPVISASGTTSRLVLGQSAALHQKIVKAVSSMVLPKVGTDVTSYMSFMTGRKISPYHPRALTNCWSASGDQFVTSAGWLSLIEQRSAQAAKLSHRTPPAVEAVDEEDFGAVMTAVEFGKPWFIVRTAVDLASQRTPSVGVPIADLNKPNVIPGWLDSHHQQSFISDYDAMYRNIGLVTHRIVANM